MLNHTARCFYIGSTALKVVEFILERPIRPIHCSLCWVLLSSCFWTSAGSFEFAVNIFRCVRRIFSFNWGSCCCTLLHFSLEVVYILWSCFSAFKARVPNSNCSLGQIKTCEVTRGPHYDADAITVVPELTRNRFYVLVRAKRFHEL